MGFNAILYRRPASVPRAFPKHSGSFEQKDFSPVDSNSSHPFRIPGIPDALSFDKIIAGGTCPVCIIFLPTIIPFVQRKLVSSTSLYL